MKKNKGERKTDASPTWCSLAQRKEGRIQGEETEREEPWTSLFFTKFTQTSPYSSLTELQKAPSFLP